MEKENKFNKQNYDNEYIKKNKDRINFVMPKGRKEEIKEAAAVQGISSSEWINGAIEAKLAGEGNINVRMKYESEKYIDLMSIEDLEAFARSAGLSVKEYAEQAIREKMKAQEKGFVEDIERVVIDIC